MDSSKWIILITAIYIFCLPRRGTGQYSEDLEDTGELKLKTSDKGMEVSLHILLKMLYD